MAGGQTSVPGGLELTKEEFMSGNTLVTQKDLVTGAGAPSRENLVGEQPCKESRKCEWKATSKTALLVRGESFRNRVS